MTTQPIDIKALRKLAEAATPGPWNIKEHGIYSEHPEFKEYGGNVCHLDFPDYKNAPYLLAVNPTRMLTLLDALESAVEALKDAQETICGEFCGGKGHHPVCKTPSAALSRLAELGVG